jgi:hypothetical protein
MDKVCRVKRLLVRKPEERRPLGSSGHRWVDIKMDFRRTVWFGIDWNDLAQDRD